MFIGVALNKHTLIASVSLQWGYLEAMCQQLSVFDVLRERILSRFSLRLKWIFALLKCDIKTGFFYKIDYNKLIVCTSVWYWV